MTITASQVPVLPILVPSTSTTVTGKDIGTYYYRVMAGNDRFESTWSNIKSAEVTVPLPECPEIVAWRGGDESGSPHRI